MGRENCGRKEKYPYAEWFDGEPHILEAGTDWSSTLSRDAFIRALHSGAARRGLKVTTKYMYLGPRRVQIQASPR